jgi:hypothetical protein
VNFRHLMPAGKMVNFRRPMPQPNSPFADQPGTMSASMLPPDGSYIEMTSDGEYSEVRVVQSSGASVTLSIALDYVPPLKSQVELRWPAPPRGRMSQYAQVISIDGNRVEVRTIGEPEVVQMRSYVRGGGGETITMIRPGMEPARGVVHDMSERAVRAHFTDVKLKDGESMLVRITLGDDEVVFPATVFKVSSMRQQVPAEGPLSVEMVAVFDEEQNESQAKIVRRYIMRHQLLSRNRVS